ncbi:MAG: hypothetical protein ACP5MM_09805, partial [Acidithiobacillus sp.]
AFSRPAPRSTPWWLICSAWRRKSPPLAREVPQLQRAEERLRRAASERNVTLIDYESVRSQSLAKGLQLLALQQAYAEQQAALTMAIGGTWKGQP